MKAYSATNKVKNMQQKIIVMPAARQTYNVHNQATVLYWDLVAPKGKQLQGIRIDGRVNQTGISSGTGRMHKAIKTIKVISDMGSVMEAIQDAIPMGTVVSQALKEDKYYDATPGNTDVCRDPVVVAAATNYDATFNIHAPLPGSKFSVQLNLEAYNAAFPGTGTMSAATSDWQVTAIWAESQGQPQYMILMDYVSALSLKKYKDASKVALFKATEWSTVMNALKLGQEISQAQISILADQSNDYLRGLAADGSGTATRTLPVLDPGTGANVFSLIYWLDTPGAIEVATASAQTFFAIIYTKSAKLADVQVNN
jgi:hypothetical protein